MTAVISGSRNNIEGYAELTLECGHVQRVRRFTDRELIDVPADKIYGGGNWVVSKYMFIWIDREVIGLQHDCPDCWPDNLVKPMIDQLKAQANIGAYSESL